MFYIESRNRADYRVLKQGDGARTPGCALESTIGYTQWYFFV